MNTELMTIPNMLTGFRFIAAPLLLWLAWNGYPVAFLSLLAISFLSDVLDGFAARLLNQSSHFGARLDSWADLIIYTTIALSVWWLWPQVVRAQIIWIVMVVMSFVLPPVIGLIRFRTITSYHIWTVKLAVALTGISLYIMLIFEVSWPFQFSAIICLIAAFEEIAITLWLQEPHSNVRSIITVIHRFRQVEK